MTNSSNKTRILLKEFKNLIIWVIIALIIRWQVIEPRWIPSGSMLPTLQIKDKILVEKLTTTLNFSNNLKGLKDQIIIFNAPEILINSGYESNTALIKRVIGIPGDKIEIKEGTLYVNDILQNKYPSDENINYTIGPYIVPENSLWVMGDNRNNSLDSHVWGFLPYEKVIGKALIRYWPLNKFGPIHFPNLNN
tara:strand:- start:6395 stop:6973 length:579 start_codon:yes stop_codon:yes gene_type:complete